MNDQHNAKKDPMDSVPLQQPKNETTSEEETSSCPSLAHGELPCREALQVQQNHTLWDSQFQSLVENSPDAIIRFDNELRFIYINAITLKILGLSLADCLGKTIFELHTYSHYHPSWKTHVDTVFQSKQQVKFEAEFVNNQGQHFYYHARLVPEMTADGFVLSVLCTLRDIEELKKVEFDLRASELRNHKVLSSLPDLLFYLSHEGIYLDYHVTNTHLLYKPHNSRIGKHLTQVLPLKEAHQFMSAIQQAITSGKIQSVEYQLPIHDTVCSLEARVMTYDSQSVLVIVRDITELKNLQQEISRLDQLNLVGEMAATIGHEVRNPLTTVRGFLQLLSRRDECRSFKHYFELMIEELDRANLIISDFLSLAKNKQVHLEKRNLNTIIEALTPLLQSSALVSNKTLHLNVNPVPDLLLDSKEIRQLLLNLVRNALEAVPPHSSVTIKSFIDKNHVVLAVHDDGSGIPTELLEKLGTPFLTTKENGTGLGLAVCYRIAARHKAAIEVDTSPHGTTFFIKFPL